LADTEPRSHFDAHLSGSGKATTCIAQAGAMKKIEVADKTQIKQLLYAEHVLAIRGAEFRSFGGFQLWWYDRHRGVCDCCESHWSDPRKRVTHCSLNKAAKVLWRHRHDLYMRTRDVEVDPKIQIMEHLDDTRH
jgi:hypothetical protein